MLANGVFAMAEIAIVSVRKARFHKLAEQGDRRARAALELTESPNRFLSTVQVGITLIGILAGAFGGATLARAITSVCIDSTGRAATERGYRVTVLSDCTVGRTPFEQEFFCREILPLYADVCAADAWASGLEQTT